jgi:hypothetical protein
MDPSDRALFVIFLFVFISTTTAALALLRRHKRRPTLRGLMIWIATLALIMATIAQARHYRHPPPALMIGMGVARFAIYAIPSVAIALYVPRRLEGPLLVIWFVIVMALLIASTP